MGCVRWRRGRWVLDFRDQHGIRRREATKYTRQEDYEKAVKLLGKREQETGEGQYLAKSAQKRFEDLAKAFSEAHIKVNLRHTSKRDYEGRLNNHLVPVFRGMKINTISVERVEQFRADLLAKIQSEHRIKCEKNNRTGCPHRDVGVRTVNKVLTLLGSMFRYAIKHRWASFNPASHVAKLKKERRNTYAVTEDQILRPDEIKVLLSKYEPDDERWRMMVKTAILTGLRESELFGLRWGDIDWLSSQFHVRQQCVAGRFSEPKTKNGIRRVDIPAVLISELKVWKLRCPNGEYDLVFPNGAGNPEGHGNLLRRGFKPFLRKAGLREIRFHDLRHTYASMLFESGANIKYVSEVLGHANPTITLNVYTHLLKRSNPQAAEKLASLALGKTKQDESGHKLVTNFKKIPVRYPATSQPLDLIMPRGGIEPSTQGFSGLCSTD